MIILFWIYFILLIFYNLTRNKHHSNYLDIKPFLKTGDLIFFHCENKGFMYHLRLLLTGHEYNHVGFIYKENDKLYLVDSTHGKTKKNFLNKKSGIRKVLLEDTLKNLGRKYYCIKFIDREISNDKFNLVLEKYKNMEFPLKMKTFFDIITFNSEEDYTMFCSEFVYQVLKDLGRVWDLPAKMIFPSYLLKLTGFSKPYSFIL